MLWNVIYEFFVKYVFGGYLFDSSSNSPTGYACILFVNNSNGLYNTADLGVTLFDRNVPFGNYLSLIATIISMVAIVLICCALIKKIYNMCAHIIG